MSEKQLSSERRQNSRVFFSLEDEIGAILAAHGDTKEEVPVTVLSLSPGGLSFMGNRYKLPGMHEGETLVFNTLTTPDPLGPIERIEAVVRYVLDIEHNVRISVGCEFVKVPRALEKKIEDYVSKRLDPLAFELNN